MADLKPVIRLKTHQLDQKKRALAELYKQHEELKLLKTEKLDQLSRERELVGQDGSIDAQITYMHYSERVKNQITDIDTKMDKLEVQISKAQDLMRDAFADLKKVEIIQERREEQERQAEKKKEDKELDDIGVEQFRRQKDSENEQSGS